MAKEFCCVRQFRCRDCQCTNMEKSIVKAESREEAEGRVLKGVATCKFCGKPAPSGTRFDFSTEESIPDADLAKASEQPKREKAKVFPAS
jgi:hypothetical protein